MVIRKPQKPRRARKAAPKKDEWVSKDPTLWDDLLAIAQSIPDEEAAKFPKDGSTNLDHYIYGAPKKS